ncbi:MAG: hypothetical protein IJC65_05185 [Oscillospiraceae bacterium]|nr:hypothetical protein [Oscillospiraceae bacterium]
MNNKDSFSYTYSAGEQEEIKRIREKYLPKEADRMQQIRDLDKSVTTKGTVLSLILGVLGTLVMGLGMSMCLVWGEKLFVMGVIIGVLGIAALSIAYPVYSYITKKEKERVAPLILSLTEELMK